MRKILTAFIIICTTIPCMAQQVIIEKNSATENIEFEDLEKITFNDNVVNIKLTNGNNISATMSEISRIRFSDYNNIEGIKMQAKDFIRYISSDIIAVNCKAGSIVTVYDIIGSQIVCTRQVADNGTISVSNLPKGVYIIKSEKKTAKFVKR